MTDKNYIPFEAYGELLDMITSLKEENIQLRDEITQVNRHLEQVSGHLVAHFAYACNLKNANGKLLFDKFCLTHDRITEYNKGKNKDTTNANVD